MSDKLSSSMDDLSIVGDCCSSKSNYDDCLKRLQILEQLINEQSITIKDLIEDKEKNEIKFKDLDEKYKSLENEVKAKKQGVMQTPYQNPLNNPTNSAYFKQLMEIGTRFSNYNQNRVQLNELPKIKEENKKLTEEVKNFKRKISELEIEKSENEKKFKEEIEKIQNDENEIKDELKKQNSFLSKQIEEIISEDSNCEDRNNLKELFKFKEECQKLNGENNYYLNKNNQLLKQLEEVNSEMLKIKKENELNLGELNKFQNLNYGRIYFKIEKFSEFVREGLEGYRKSEAVYIGGFPWKIEVKPKEKGKYLGFYLNCNDENNDSSWECSATVRFMLHNSRIKNSYSYKSNHIFHSKEYSCGYSQFITFQEIMNPYSGWYNNKDDTITLYVEVDIDE